MQKTHVANSSALLRILSIVLWVLSIMIQSRRPTWLGGVPRKCVFHSGRPKTESLNEMVALVEKGRLRGVTDSVYEMEDVIKVSKFWLHLSL